MMPRTADPAAILACALSLHAACIGQSKLDPNLNLNETYGGGEEFMRQVMRVANLFEEWSSEHVAFGELGGAWSSLLEDRFGDACLGRVSPAALASFGRDDCLRVALQMRIPIRWNEELRLPVDLIRDNPLPGPGFVQFRIRTMCEQPGDSDVTAFAIGDDPFDETRDAPFFALYGLDGDGLPEHIADRASYAAIRGLALKLAPGISFPEVPMATAQAASVSRPGVGV